MEGFSRNTACSIPGGADRARQALDGLDQAYTRILTNLNAVWNGPAGEQEARMGAAVAGMSELRTPIRIRCAYYLNYQSEDESDAIWQPALMSLQIPEEIIANLYRLYPDEWNDMNQYTDLTQPVYFGPRFLNMNATELPAI